MSQNDFDLTTADANTGPTVRAGMNAMAQALATNNEGATEPATKYPSMFWPDTTSGYMKQRNTANNAWLNRWKLSEGQLAALSGFTMTGLANLAAGADIASAATIDLTAATGNSPRITGTTPTSAVTMNTGQQMLVVADGAWPLTYHATTNKINIGRDYTCVAGDRILYTKDLSGVVHGTVLGVETLTNYSAISTIVGWSSFTNKEIYYKKIGDIVQVYFRLQGTSNATGATFTLPFVSDALLYYSSAYVIDNSAGVTVPGLVTMGPSNSTVTVTKDMAGTVFTASGTKAVAGQFSFHI